MIVIIEANQGTPEGIAQSIQMRLAIYFQKCIGPDRLLLGSVRYFPFPRDHPSITRITP